MKKIVGSLAKKVTIFIGFSVVIVGLLSWWFVRGQYMDVSLYLQSLKPYACGDEFANFDCEVLEFQKMAEEALVWRAQSEAFVQMVTDKRRNQNKPLTSEDLQVIHQGVVDYLALRKKIMAVAYKYRKVGERDFEPNVATPEGRLFIQHSKLALAAALLLYDNYLLGIQPWQKDGFLRRLINTDNSEVSSALEKVTLSFQNSYNAAIVGRAARFYQKAVALQKDLPADTQIAGTYLDKLILGSPSFEVLKQNSGGELKMVSQSVDWFVTSLNDRMSVLRDQVMNQVSGAFGNAVGLVETRKGLLYGDSALAKKLRGELKALDILLEKTPFRLTDALIPGHWGHVAIWIGSKEELVDLGVWDHPAVVPWQKHVENGQMVVEALRSGVVANALEHFLNVDDVLVLRPHLLPLEDKKAFAIKTFQQLGKAYDFNFDVETDKKIVCSELIYVVFYKNFTWPTARVMGRATISPDNVARAALEQTGLKPLIMYHGGKPVAKDLNRALALMLDGDYKSLEETARMDHLISDTH